MIVRMERGLRRGVREALECLAAAAKAQTPVKSGQLQASCRTECHEDGRGGTVAFTAPYAAAQHENRRLRHRNGQAGFLAEAARDPAVRGEMLQALARGLREELRG